MAKATAIKSKTLQKIFPEELGNLSEEALYGVGPFEAMPLTSPYVLVAGDRKTAKGLWMSAGYNIDVKTCGPISYWCWGTYAADFLMEDGAWKIWHLLYTQDVNSLTGQDWAKPQVPYEDLPEFAGIAEIVIPEPNMPQTVRKLYSPDRPFTLLPQAPMAYETFAETFSYGI